MAVCGLKLSNKHASIPAKTDHYRKSTAYWSDDGCCPLGWGGRSPIHALGATAYQITFEKSTEIAIQVAQGFDNSVNFSVYDISGQFAVQPICNKGANDYRADGYRQSMPNNSTKYLHRVCGVCAHHDLASKAWRV